MPLGFNVFLFLQIKTPGDKTRRCTTCDSRDKNLTDFSKKTQEYLEPILHDSEWMGRYPIE